jgi:dihydroxyacetone kinase
VTRLLDDPARFSEDVLDVHRDRVVAVSGGVVRATETLHGKVAAVVGEGSAHYPAFCGVIGPGFTDGVVAGNVFTSPSTRER